MQPRILAVTEYGRQCGLGHLHRTKALLLALEKSGCETVLTAHAVNSAADASAYLQRIENGALDFSTERCSAVLIDSYLLQPAHIGRLRQKTTIVIDDNVRLAYGADLLINPNAYATELAGAYDSHHAKTRLLGGQYALLRPEIVDAAMQPVEISESMRHLMITLGGATHSLLLEQLMGCVGHELWQEVHWVVPSGTQLPDMASHWRVSYDLDACAMAESMQRADLVLCGAGQTLGELAVLGIPALPIIVVENQQKNAEFFQRQGATPSVLRPDDNLIVEFQKALTRAAPHVARQKMSNLGKKLISPKGCDSCARAIIETISLQG